MNSTASKIAHTTKNVVRRLTGVARAQREVDHIGTHLKNVETWAQQQIAELTASQHQTIAAYEQRLLQLEKTRAAFLAAAAPVYAKTSLVPLEHFTVPDSYFAAWSKAFEQIQAQSQLLQGGLRVVELQCGLGKALQAVVDTDATYEGFDTSPTLIETARDYHRDEAGSFNEFSLESIRQRQQTTTDLVILAMEADRWSMVDAELLFQHSADLLAESKGRFLFLCPYSTEDMEQAGWNVAHRLTETGFAIELQGVARVESLGEGSNRTSGIDSASSIDYILARRT